MTAKYSNVPDEIKILVESEKRRLRDLRRREEEKWDWKQSREVKIGKQRENRKKMKQNNPEEYKRIQDERNEKRRQQRISTKEESWHKTWNELFAKIDKKKWEVSKKEWERLKDRETKMRHEYGVSEIDAIKHQHDVFSFLKSHLDHPCGSGLLFYLKTLTHNCNFQRVLTKEKIASLDSIVLLPLPEKEVNKIRNKEKEQEYSKSYYVDKKQKSYIFNLNERFMKADPNKVLSLDDIANNPYFTNYSPREEFKVNLFKDLSEKEIPEYLEKWEAQREIYEAEVEDLSVEYKEQFLKQMEDKDYSDEFNERKERYLDHHRRFSSSDEDY